MSQAVEALKPVNIDHSFLPAEVEVLVEENPSFMSMDNFLDWTVTGANTPEQVGVEVAQVASGSGHVEYDTNVRSSKGTDTEIITTLSARSSFDLLALDGEWYRVRLSDGREGFILAELVNVDTPMPVAAPEAPTENPNATAVAPGSVEGTPTPENPLVLTPVAGSEMPWYFSTPPSEIANAIGEYHGLTDRSGAVSPSRITVEYKQDIDIRYEIGLYGIVIESPSLRNISVLQEDGEILNSQVYVVPLLVMDGSNNWKVIEVVLGEESTKISRFVIENGTLTPNDESYRTISVAEVISDLHPNMQTSISLDVTPESIYQTRISGLRSKLSPEQLLNFELLLEFTRVGGQSTYDAIQRIISGTEEEGVPTLFFATKIGINQH